MSEIKQEESSYHCGEVAEIRKILEDLEFHHEKLFTKNVKCSSVESRKCCMRVIKICQQMRKDCLSHKKSLPTKARKSKKKVEDSPKVVVDSDHDVRVVEETPA